MKKLTEQEIDTQLKDLKGWKYEGNSIVKNFTLPSFFDAYTLLSKAAFIAEKMNHHPDWSNAWNKVTVDLSTHSAGGLTRNDFDLAAKIQEIYGG